MECWDENSGIVKGFGILENEKMICGGFEAPDILKKETDDGWIIKTRREMRLNWQKKELMAEIMFIQKANVKEKVEIGVFHYGINRGYGFSDTGNSNIEQ